jgi:hypothetical protein
MTKRETTDWTCDDEVEDAQRMTEALHRAGGEIQVYARQINRLLQMHRKNMRTIRDLRKRNRYLARQVYLPGVGLAAEPVAPKPVKEDVKDVSPASPPPQKGYQPSRSWGDKVRLRQTPHAYIASSNIGTLTECSTCGLYAGAPVHHDASDKCTQFKPSPDQTWCVNCGLAVDAHTRSQLSAPSKVSTPSNSPVAGRTAID